jgi:hypothetical protein
MFDFHTKARYDFVVDLYIIKRVGAEYFWSFFPLALSMFLIKRFIDSNGN